jgi:hypothetical protein
MNGNIIDLVEIVSGIVLASLVKGGTDGLIQFSRSRFYKRIPTDASSADASIAKFDLPKLFSSL